MAAQEYFSSFNQGPQQGPPYSTTPGPPQYNPSPYQQPPHLQQQPYGAPPVQQPYAAPPQPWDPRQGYSHPSPAVHNQGYPPQRPSPAVPHSTLMPPLQPHRSRSEPPENRRATLDVPHRHHHHRHHRSDSRSRSRSRPRSGRSGHSHHSHRDDNRSSGPSGTRSRARSGRDAFLGAGGGAIIGDTLVPGLGTLSGALLGAFGGNKYAKKQSPSDVGGSDRERRRYKDGITVHSRWGPDR